MTDDLDRQLATASRDVYLLARGWLAGTPLPAVPTAVEVLDRAWHRRGVLNVPGEPDDLRRMLVHGNDRADVEALVELLREPYVGSMLGVATVRRLLKALGVALEVELWRLDGELEALVGERLDADEHDRLNAEVADIIANVDDDAPGYTIRVEWPEGDVTL